MQARNLPLFVRVHVFASLRAPVRALVEFVAVVPILRVPFVRPPNVLFPFYPPPHALFVRALRSPCVEHLSTEQNKIFEHLI